MAVNDDLLDLAVSHAVGLQRHASSLVRQVLRTLGIVEEDILKQVPNTEFGQTRLDRVLKGVREASSAGYEQVRKQMEKDLVELAKYEAEFQRKGLIKTATVELEVAKPAAAQIKAAATSRPMQGALLKEWVKGLDEGQFKRTRDAIRIGFVEGETTDQIVRRLRGTKAAKYKDGVFEVSRRSAESVVRTAVNHTATRARETLYEENADLIKGVRWVSTLDSRTSAVCRARDGEIYPPNSGPRPPAHINCRSTTVPVLKSWKDLGIDAEDLPPGSRASMDGQVPGDLTYQQWLRKKSAAFQDEVLGKTKGKLFRDGGLTLDRFVDRAGQAYTLDELRRRESAAFDKIGD